MDAPGDQDLLILFGSETGTAKDVAWRLARGAMRFGLAPVVKCMSLTSPEEIKRDWSGPKFVLFAVCTTGQGDPPGNMKDFWKNLCRAKWNSDFYSDLNFGVIALGDSSYAQYNFVGKKLFRRLQQLGGKPVLELCLGDDQHELGYHSTVNPWIKSLWSVICEQRGISADPEFEVTIQFPKESRYTKLRIAYGDDDDLSEGMLINHEQAVYRPEFAVNMGKIFENERLTSLNHWQDTRLITIDHRSLLKYEPGDVLIVQPTNLPENIAKFFEIFPTIKRDDPFFLYHTVNWIELPQEILYSLGPQPWTWKQVVLHLLDIQSVPGLYFFELMSEFATDELEKERLSEFCTAEGQIDLLNYCHRPKRNILEVLEDFPCTTKEIPAVYLLDLIPFIKPRKFSIANSNIVSPEKVQILVAVVDYQTVIKNKRRGLCSNWLAHHCCIGDMIPIWTQKGSFTFPPPDKETAVIMVGPGTGVAPFRSLIQERLSTWDKHLFFGCRNEATDFYFEKEWDGMVHSSSLKLHAAFSRDENGSKRDYVQDVILQQSEELQAIFSSKKIFYIFVAGNAKQMPKDVRAAIAKVMEKSGIEEPMKFIDMCAKKLGRYQTETWS